MKSPKDDLKLADEGGVSQVETGEGVEVNDSMKQQFVMRQVIAEADRKIAKLNEERALILEAYKRNLSKPVVGFADFTRALKEGRDAVPPSYSADYFNIIKNLSSVDREKWNNLVIFLCHDIRHISETELYEHAKQIDWAYFLKNEKQIKPAEIIFEEEWQKLYQEIVAQLDEIMAQLAAPHHFAKALAELELKKDVSVVEEVDVGKMASIVARTLQMRFVFDDYAVTDGESRKQDRNEMIVSAPNTKLRTNQGMLWSVIYNLMKNAAKELGTENPHNGLESTALHQRVLEDQLPENPAKIWVTTQSLEKEGVTLIHVGDSGEGLKLDEIMNSIKEIITGGLLPESGLQDSMTKILSEWQKNPFAIRALKMGDVFDLAGAARASGFITRERLGGQSSSGMGLWGVNYLIEKMGGQIIYTNTVDGGALFTIIIPNNHFERAGDSGVRKTTAQVRKAIEKGRILVDLPIAA